MRESDWLQGQAFPFCRGRGSSSGPRLIGFRPGADDCFSSCPEVSPRGLGPKLNTLALGSEHMYFSSSGSYSEISSYRCPFKDQITLGMVIRSLCRIRDISRSLASGNVTYWIWLDIRDSGLTCVLTVA